MKKLKLKAISHHPQAHIAEQSRDWLKPKLSAPVPSCTQIQDYAFFILGSLLHKYGQSLNSLFRWLIEFVLKCVSLAQISLSCSRFISNCTLPLGQCLVASNSTCPKLNTSPSLPNMFLSCCCPKIRKFFTVHSVAPRQKPESHSWILSYPHIHIVTTSLIPLYIFFISAHFFSSAVSLVEAPTSLASMPARAS